MIKGVTKTGFKYEVKKENINDFELIEKLAEMKENPILMIEVLDMILGKKQREKLKEHCRNKEGKVPIDKMTVEFENIFNSPELKNF